MEIKFVGVKGASQRNARFQEIVNVNNMKNKKLKRLSLINLITGYTMMFLLVLLVILNRQSEVVEEIDVASDQIDLFNGVHKDNPEKEIVYIDRHPVEVISDRSIGLDRGAGVILDDDPDVIVFNDDRIAVIDNPNHVVIDNREDDLIVHRSTDLIGGNLNNETHLKGYDEFHSGNAISSIPNRGVRGGDSRHATGNQGDIRERDTRIDDKVGTVDIAALERAIAEDREDEFGVDGDELAGLTLARDNRGDFEVDIKNPKAGEVGSNGYGLDKGDLYAYNSPSQGVGAGIGSPAVGAGVGAAGIGAGIGEAVLNGNSVPTLGGIGTYSPPPEGSPAEGGPALSPPTMGGVGGLVSGAGAGGAAGLVTKTVKEKLGLGIGSGKGCALHGGGCDGHHGHGDHRNYNLDHLPRDGALHIMMHVDGSGSILNTRKQLEVMKDSLLKDALLPYYNNDEGLYNRRVSIVDSSGERTLQFFNEATSKDNVLAVVFQDEAQPAYHMPNFNRKPEKRYLDDLNTLKSSLGTHSGLYRGIMFQVDRGKTYAKSFKEFVENSWQGSGYLQGHNLKKYYWEENKHHIDNKDGIVFSDVYHTKDEGDPQYYLDLIFEASKRVGLDLNIYGAGLTDGKHNEQ